MLTKQHNVIEIPVRSPERTQASHMFSTLKTMARRKLLARQLKDADPEARTAAVEELGELGQPADVDVIVAALKDEDVSVRKAAAKALRAISDPKASEPLMKCLIDAGTPEGAWQTEILYALESLNDPRSVNACAQALTNSNAKVRRAAASALGNLGEPLAIPSLVAAMRDEDDEVVRQAGFALTKLGGSAVAPLIQMLECDSGRTRQAAADALGVIGDPRAIEPLIAALQCNDSFMQITVAKALSKFNDPRVAAPLIQALGESSTAAFFYGVREEAEAALVNMGRHAIEPFLVALRDPNAGGRAIIARLLGQIPDARSVEPLLEALDDPDPELRKAALRSLMTLDPRRAMPVAQSKLSDPNSHMRHAAAELLLKSGWAPATRLDHAQLAIGLGKFHEAIGDGDEAIQLLLERSQDEDATIRCGVFKALGQSRDPRLLDPLAAAAATESEPEVQRAIFEALEGMGPDATAALVCLLEAGGWPVRRLALKRLRALGWVPANPAQQVLHALCSNDPAGAAAVGEIAVEQLMMVMNDASDPEIQRTAADAYQKLHQAWTPGAAPPPAAVAVNTLAVGP
jgi:HEAT repeat protein